MNKADEVLRLRLNNNGSKRLEYLMFTTSDKITKNHKKRTLTWVDESAGRRQTNNVYVDDLVMFFTRILATDDIVRRKVLSRVLLEGASNLLKNLEKETENDEEDI
jgi:hypothetical protein